ncbi:hypothetical protein PI125_g26139 [Phytophthora idaei]|nr:hypothetical protein PI125_g26139 [Phytophthora idaei]
MYLGGEEIFSNEYEDEPDLGSSSGVHSPQFARLSTESSRAHRAVVAAGAERHPSYGQPQVDRDSRALYDRVAALEQFQSGEFAQVQQELRYQKAQVAQAAQTASNIQVELGTQVVRLHDRVAALEKLAYAASSSSASHQGQMARVACTASTARHRMSDGAACWTVCPTCTRCHAVQAL